MSVRPPSRAVGSRPSAAQVAAFGWSLENQVAVRDAMLSALLTEYPGWREYLADRYDEDDAEPRVPPVETPDKFRNLIGPVSVHVSRAEWGGVAYVGHEFGCTWDDEHGLEFTTHRDRVVKVGGPDTSFTECVADQDDGRS